MKTWAEMQPQVSFFPFGFLFCLFFFLANIWHSVSGGRGRNTGHVTFWERKGREMN